MTETTPTYTEQIAAILRSFNFAKVHTAMTALDWVWVDAESRAETVPSEGRLRETAKRLLVQSSEPNRSAFRTIRSGGFIASREDGWLMLEFRLEVQSAVDCIEYEKANP